MMLCDISVVFNSFADAFGLMSRKRSSESRQELVSFQSTESFGRLQYAGGGALVRGYLIDPQRVYIGGLSAGAVRPPSWARPTSIFMPQTAYILASPVEPPTTFRQRLSPCGKVTRRMFWRPATFRRFSEMGRRSRPSFFTAIATPWCILATAITSSRGRCESQTREKWCIAVGSPKGMPIPERSIPTRAAAQSLSIGKSMEPHTRGRGAARPAPSPIREDRTPRGKCCASSSNTRSRSPTG
jgi:hypothetical protein